MSIRIALQGRLAALAVLAGIVFAGPAQAAGEPLVVYSARKYQLVEQLFQEYGRERGIEVKSVTDDGAPLIQRLTAEGANSPADVFISVDAGDLWRATQAGLLQPVKSAALEAAIPAHLRDPEGHWFGLAVRARTIAYSTARVKPSDLSTYAALGDARWKGKLCLRSGKAVYNQSLVAMFINDMGEEAAERMVRAWIGNLAAEPFSNDTLMLKAIAAGQCDVGITNSYYLGRLQNEQKDLPGADLLGRPGGQGHARQHLGRRRHQAREEPRRGGALPRMARVARDPAAFRRGQLRVPGECRRRSAARSEGLGRVQAEHGQRRPHRQDATRRRHADRPRRLALTPAPAARP